MFARELVPRRFGDRGRAAAIADCGCGVQTPQRIWPTIFALFRVVFLVSETIPRALERASVSKGALQDRLLDFGHLCGSSSVLEEGGSKKVDARRLSS